MFFWGWIYFKNVVRHQSYKDSIVQPRACRFFKVSGSVQTWKGKTKNCPAPSSKWTSPSPFKSRDKGKCAEICPISLCQSLLHLWADLDSSFGYAGSVIWQLCDRQWGLPLCVHMCSAFWKQHKKMLESWDIAKGNRMFVGFLLVQLIFGRSCWWGYMGVASNVTWRHHLTAMSPVIWLLESLWPLFCNVPWAVGVWVFCRSSHRD